MNELLEKIGINPALSGKKMFAALRKERRKTYALWHTTANDPRQKLLLRMRLEDIRKAETAPPKQNTVSEKVRAFIHRHPLIESLVGNGKTEASPALANLSMFLAPFSIFVFWLFGTIHAWAGDAGAETEALFNILDSLPVMTLMGIIPILVALAGFVVGIRSFMLTAGALKRKCFGIIFSFIIMLFLALSIYPYVMETLQII